MLVQLVPLESGLELRAEEPVAIAGVAEDEEVEGEDGSVDGQWPQDEAQTSRQEVLHEHALGKAIHNNHPHFSWTGINGFIFHIIIVLLKVKIPLFGKRVIYQKNTCCSPNPTVTTLST